jgi:ParB-like chromosome segregation protein Spo0J
MNKHLKLTIEALPLSSLKPHPQNPRVHPPLGSPEWKSLKASLEHDYYDPLIWNKRNGCLVSGHLRTKVLEAEGVQTVACVIVDYDEPTHVARMIAANRQIGQFDDLALATLLSECEQPALAGMTDAQLAELIGEAQSNAAPPDDFPAVDERLPVDYTCPKCRFSWSGKPA